MDSGKSSTIYGKYILIFSIPCTRKCKSLNLFVNLKAGKIIDPSILFFESARNFDHEVDCKRALIAPGLIDLQINGGFKVLRINCRPFFFFEGGKVHWKMGVLSTG